MLGWWVIWPIDPAYHIEDWLILAEFLESSQNTVLDGIYQFIVSGIGDLGNFWILPKSFDFRVWADPVWNEIIYAVALKFMFSKITSKNWGNLPVLLWNTAWPWDTQQPLEFGFYPIFWIYINGLLITDIGKKFAGNSQY